jgi:hypothetical protein
LRTLDDYNHGILEILLKVLATPVDVNRLRARVMDLRRIEIYRNVLEDRVRELASLQNSPSYRIGRAIVNPMRPFHPAIRAVWRFVRRPR